MKFRYSQEDTRYYCCEKCKIVSFYHVMSDGNTDFDRGEYLVHFDYLTTGFKTEAEAQAYLDRALDAKKTPVNS